MMCRVGQDLCTAATAAVVIDRTELDEHDTDQSVLPPGNTSHLVDRLPLERRQNIVRHCGNALSSRGVLSSGFMCNYCSFCT